MVKINLQTQKVIWRSIGKKDYEFGFIDSDLRNDVAIIRNN